MLATLQIPASATTTDPYTSASTGFDISYPNCSSVLPSGDSFAVVGVGGGRPFTTNSCASSEWTQTQGVTGGATPSLYFNTGYAGAYSRKIDATCQSEVSSAGVFSGLSNHALSQAEQAWEIGCSEVDYANTNRPGQLTKPTMWWADIETGNSWSTNASLNDYAIDGISHQMALLGAGGIYSSLAMWSSITGSSSWEPSPIVAANWVRGGSCATTFGTKTLTWLSQGASIGGVDSDTAC